MAYFKNKIFTFSALLFGFTILGCAATGDLETSFDQADDAKHLPNYDGAVSDFILGEYILVGKGLDSDSTYSGKVKIYREGGELKMQRHIGKTRIVGTAAIEKALHSDAEVLRLRYSESSLLFEQTCLAHSDLDNYARISCYLYKPGVKTNMPGMEVLFYDHNAR